MNNVLFFSVGLYLEVKHYNDPVTLISRKYLSDSVDLSHQADHLMYEYLNLVFLFYNSSRAPPQPGVGNFIFYFSIHTLAHIEYICCLCPLFFLSFLCINIFHQLYCYCMISFHSIFLFFKFRVVSQLMILLKVCIWSFIRDKIFICLCLMMAFVVSIVVIEIFS